jgi:hypothetical protein
MSSQMSLLAQPEGKPLVVPVAWEVLHLGADARADRGRGEQLFPHRHVPSPPARLPDEARWLAALDFAEDARRYNQAARAVLDLSKRDGAGSNGPLGTAGPTGPRIMASSRGVEVDDGLATWPQLLAGRAEQREIEVEIARARDLAQAYHCLDYYGRVYGEPEDRDGFDGIGEQWSPVPLIRRLAEEAIDLGGDPTQLRLHTSYMRQGIAEARQ